MWVIVLTLALFPGKQQIYTDYGSEPIRFATQADCAARAKQEVVRLSHAKNVRGEFELYCVPEASLNRST